MIYIGIDPGLTGAIGVLSGGSTEGVYDMPTVTAGKGVVKNEIDPAALAGLLELLTEGVMSSVLLERTSSMPKQGVASTFSMGVTRGVILGVLGALRIPYREVAPATWKRHYGLIGADKDRSRTIAIQRFPSLAAELARKKDHNRAEAVLLADYLRGAVK